MEALERWKNDTACRVVVRRLSPTGVRDEIIRGGAEFHLTADERDMNHARSRPELDPFLDGTLSYLGGGDPERIPDSVNRLTDDDIETVVEGHWKKAEKRLSELDSPSSLERLLRIAEDGDVGEKRVSMIRERLRAVAPQRVEANRSRRVAEQPIDPDDPALRPPEEVDFYNMSPQGAVSFTPGVPAR